jgi:hypothetical protein
MLSRFRLLSVIVCLFGLLFIIPGCQKKPESGDVSYIPENLAIAALQTHARYIKAVNSGQQEPSDEISRQYWTDEIKRLNPIKVYMHRINLVVVQKETAHKQAGLYIILMISSYAPQSGDDGFTFTEIGNSVYNFKRVIEN